MCSAPIAAHHVSMNPLSSTRDLYSTNVCSDESDLTTCALRRFLVTNWVVAKVAKLAKPPSLAVPKFHAASEERCKGGYRRVCETLPLDVVVLEVYQNNVMYGSSEDPLLILYARI